MTRTTTARRRTPKKKPQPRPDYSPRWLERYGRTLTGDEIQLVQASRGMDEQGRDCLLNVAGRLVLARPKRRVKR
jgi:hypothetical protein